MSFLSVYSKHFIDSQFITTAAGREPFANKVRPLANQTNVEHAAIVEAAVAGGKSVVRDIWPSAFHNSRRDPQHQPLWRNPRALSRSRTRAFSSASHTK